MHPWKLLAVNGAGMPFSDLRANAAGPAPPGPRTRAQRATRLAVGTWGLAGQQGRSLQQGLAGARLLPAFLAPAGSAFN